MDSNWVSALDMLAAGGVIDFDAPAYLLDQKPRYVGHPDLERLPLENPIYLPQGTKLKNVPDKDLFDKSKDGNLIHNPKWKKFMFGAVALGGIISAFIFLKNPLSAIKSFKLPKLSLPKLNFPKFTGVKNFASKIWNGIKVPFNWIASKIKKP